MLKGTSFAKELFWFYEGLRVGVENMEREVMILKIFIYSE